jgi:hypothetical protein
MIVFISTPEAIQQYDMFSREVTPEAIQQYDMFSREVTHEAIPSVYGLSYIFHIFWYQFCRIMSCNFTHYYFARTFSSFIRSLEVTPEAIQQYDMFSREVAHEAIQQYDMFSREVTPEAGSP